MEDEEKGLICPYCNKELHLNIAFKLYKLEKETPIAEQNPLLSDE